MKPWSRIEFAVRNLLHKSRIESELDAEIRGYVDAAADEKIAKGIPPGEAHRQALAECGGMEPVKQAVREGRAGTGIERLWQDVRYTLRQLSRNPAFAWTAVITLGLGIGATTSIFSAVYALLIRPLPYPQSDQLTYISVDFPTGGGDLVSPGFCCGTAGSEVVLAGCRIPMDELQLDRCRRPCAGGLGGNHGKLPSYAWHTPPAWAWLSRR